VAAKLQTSETGLTYLPIEEEGALVRAAVEEADDVRVLEFGDDGHLARRVDTLVRLPMGGERWGASRDAFAFHWQHDRSVVAPYCAAAAAAEFAEDFIWVQKTGSETLPGRTGARRASYDELLHGLRREPGKIALRQGGIHLPHAGDIRRGLDADLDAGVADGDAVAVLEGYAGILALGSLFRGFTFFATAAFFPVDVGAVHAAEVAQGGLRRAGFEQEVVARDLVVVRQAEVAVLHPPEKEGVMFW